MAEMSPALDRAFARHRDDPGHCEPVIVTVAAGCELNDVQGLDERGTARGGTIVRATATAAAARELEARGDVVRLEHDGGDMQALD